MRGILQIELDKNMQNKVTYELSIILLLLEIKLLLEIETRIKVFKQSLF